mgnify:FL=1
MRVLGIDYGTKRVGVAIGDTDAKVAVPLCVIEESGVRSQESGVLKLVRDEDIELVVMGQGGKGPIEEKVQEFAKKLRKFVPVEIADEHFTTAQVERVIRGYGKARKGVDKDSAAAALILQGWLDPAP